jgi:hypothetical protein
VIVACLVNPAPHVGKAYRPTGPRLLSPPEIAEAMGSALGRRVRYQDVPLPMFLKAASSLGIFRTCDFAALLVPAGLSAQCIRRRRPDRCRRGDRGPGSRRFCQHCPAICASLSADDTRALRRVARGVRRARGRVGGKTRYRPDRSAPRRAACQRIRAGREIAGMDGNARVKPSSPTSARWLCRRRKSATRPMVTAVEKIRMIRSQGGLVLGPVQGVQRENGLGCKPAHRIPDRRHFATVPSPQVAQIEADQARRCGSAAA